MKFTFCLLKLSFVALSFLHRIGASSHIEPNLDHVSHVFNDTQQKQQATQMFVLLSIIGCFQSAKIAPVFLYSSIQKSWGNAVRYKFDLSWPVHVA